MAKRQKQGPASPDAPSGQPKARPTIETVAERAGVSRQTVSNAANAPHRLRPETLRRVLGTIDELGYRPSQAARSLRTRSTRLIGCRLLPGSQGVTAGVLDRLLHALCDAARSNGYDVLTFSVGTDDDEIEVFNDLTRRHTVDGFVLTNTHHGDMRPNWLVSQGANFVAFGRPWGVDKPVHSWVDVDGADGTREAVQYLAELGHTRIAFLGFPEGSGVGDDRYSGWLRAMEGLRLPWEGLSLRAENGVTSGKALADALLDGPNPPSGVVCASDALAVGALRAIEDRGLRAGSDVSVVGFDDSPIASVVRPQLTSVHQPLESVAQKLVEILLAEILGQQRRPSRALLAPRLVTRESTAERSSILQRSSGTEAVAGHTVIALPKRNRKEQMK